MTAFPEAAWWESYSNELLADEELREAARYFPVRLEFRYGAGSTLDVRDGRVVSATDGPLPLGADITLSAPDHEWQRTLAGKTDFFHGTPPGLGEIEVACDVVCAMGHVMVRDCAVLAMSCAGHGPAAPPQPAQPFGRDVAGRYVDVDGLRIYIEEAGDGPTTIICFHAVCQDAVCQDTMMYTSPLSDEFRVISVDAPSHGKTLEPESGEFRSLTLHAEFNERLMEMLCPEKPVIVGCSMSGNLVLELGSRPPEAYGAIISCERADYSPTVSQHLLDMLLLHGQQILECSSQSLTGNRTPTKRAREVVGQIRRANPEVVAGDLTGYAGFDKHDAVGDVRSPCRSGATATGSSQRSRLKPRPLASRAAASRCWPQRATTR